MSREQYFSPLPQRFEQTVTDQNYGNTDYGNLLRKSWAKVLSTPNRRATIDLHQGMDSIMDSFIGDGIYMEERLGDILHDCITTSDANLRNRFLSSAFIVLDLNEFRAFDLADKAKADENANRTGEIIQRTLQSSGQDYDNFVSRIFGDEYYILRVPKNQKALSEMKEDHMTMLKKIGAKIGDLSGPKIMNGNKQPVTEKLSSKALAAFICEGVSQTPNLDPEQNRRDQFMITIRKIREKLVDIKDLNQSSGLLLPRTVKIEPTMPRSCFGATHDEGFQNALRISRNYLSSKPYQELERNKLAPEDKDPKNMNYLEAKYYPLWIRQMINVLKTNPGFNNFATPLINMIAEYPLIDPFSRITRYPIYTPEGFKRCLHQELKQLSIDEDIGMIVLDPAMIKEINNYLGWQVSDNFLISIFSMLGNYHREAVQSQNSGKKFYVMKEGGRIFIAMKGKAGDVGFDITDLKIELDKLCKKLIVPVTDQSGLLNQRRDLIRSRFNLFKTDCPENTEFHTPSSIATFKQFKTHPESISKSKRLEFNNSHNRRKAIETVMDYIRSSADRNKTRNFVKYLLSGRPEAFLFFDKYGSRFATRKVKAKELIIEDLRRNSLIINEEDKKQMKILRFLFKDSHELDFIKKTIDERNRDLQQREQVIYQRLRNAKSIVNT